MLENILAKTYSLTEADKIVIWQSFAVLVISLTTHFITRTIFYKLGSKKESGSFKHVFTEALKTPIFVLLWTISFIIIFSLIYERFKFPLLGKFLKLDSTIYILILSWFAIRFVDLGINVATKKYPNLTTGQIDTIKKFSTIIVIVSSIILILPSLGVSISGLLAFGGIGGVVLGFAAKDMLANIFGALSIYLDRPFSVGDWIHFPEKNIEGIVENIGWRQVMIRNFDKRPIFIPNSMIGNLILVNPSKMTHRRIHETIGLRYEDAKKLPLIIDDIRNMMREDPDLDKNLSITANLDKFSSSSIDILVTAFSKSIDGATFPALKEKILLQIMAIIEKHGAQISISSKN